MNNINTGSLKIIAGIVFLSLAFSIEGQDELGFLYGMLGRLHSQDDTTTVLQDTSIIHTGDEIRINVGYKKDTHFYVIFKGSEGKFDLLYPQNNQLVDSIVSLNNYYVLGIGNIVDAKEFSSSMFLKMDYILPVALMAILVMLPVVYKLIKKRF